MRKQLFCKNIYQAFLLPVQPEIVFSAMCAVEKTNTFIMSSELLPNLKYMFVKKINSKLKCIFYFHLPKTRLGDRVCSILAALENSVLPSGL